MRHLWYAALCTLLIGFGLLAAGCEDGSVWGEATAPQEEAEATVPEPDSATAARFDSLVAYARAQDLHERPIGEVMQAVGLQLAGEPYVTFPLDQTDEEQLICRLDGFDCFTYVDAMLALGRGIKAQDYSYERYAQNTRDQRYRGGEMDGYCSRLHYFSEWIQDNEARGNVRDITEEIGGQRLDKQLTFMSEHRESYPRFAENDSLFQCIEEMEEELADLALYHIPQDSIRAVYDRLQTGDIVAASTNVEGLDVAHTGLVYKGEDGSTGLLHAATSGGVKVSPDLQAYVQSVDRQIGIVVARPLDPHRQE